MEWMDTTHVGDESVEQDRLADAAWERRLDAVRWVFTAVVVAVVAVSVTVVVWRVDSERGAASAQTGTPPPSAEDEQRKGRAAVDENDPVSLLRTWDAERAAAWRTGDVEALQALYVAGAAAGEEDVRRLAQWSERGWGVDGAAPQLVSVREVRGGSRERVLDVVDRLVGATAVRGEERVRLPDTQARGRRITVRMHEGRWLVAQVDDRPLT